jgi:hypothetical protein
MVVFLALGVAAVALAIAVVTGTGWLMRQRRRNDEIVADGFPLGEERTSRGGRGRFAG